MLPEIVSRCPTRLIALRDGKSCDLIVRDRFEPNMVCEHRFCCEQVMQSFLDPKSSL